MQFSPSPGPGLDPEAEERAEGMRLALETTRGLHDRVRLALGALRLKGAAPLQQRERDAAALDAVRCGARGGHRHLYVAGDRLTLARCSGGGAAAWPSALLPPGAAPRPLLPPTLAAAPLCLKPP